jgi:hypothetical protein
VGVWCVATFLCSVGPELCTPTHPGFQEFFLMAMNSKKKLTSTEACVILGRSLRTVQHLCKTGKLKAKKVGPLGRQSWEIWMDGDSYGSRKVGRSASGKKTPAVKGGVQGKNRKSRTGR